MVTNVFVPSLDDVTADNAGPLVARDAPSAQAAIHQGNDFDESNYTSVAVLLLETEGRKLGEQDHQYYNEVVRRLLDDTRARGVGSGPVGQAGHHVGVTERRRRGHHADVRPVGDLGSSEANQSIAAIRDIVAKVPKPDGLYHLYHRARTTGGRYAARHRYEPGQADDRDGHPDRHIAAHCLSVDHDRADPAVRGADHAGSGPRHHLVPRGTRESSRSPRSRPTCWCPLVLGASTDYAIFYLGRYQEARQNGEDKESSYYESVANVPHVILGSGIAISGATLCLSLTHLDYFRTLGPPCAVSMVVAVLSALTLGPGTAHASGARSAGSSRARRGPTRCGARSAPLSPGGRCR